MKLARAIVILFLILDSCIEPFNLKVKNREVLVVDGMISDQPGPYTVKIYKTLPLEDQLDETDWVRGAVVSILDDQGAEEVLAESTPGNYRSKTLQGVVGKTYHLRFTTQDGDVYESIPEKLVLVGEIAKLYAEFEEKESPHAIDPNNTINGFNILLDASVLPEQNGLVRWRWTGTFEIKAYPELKIRAATNPRTGATVILPDPEKCSGYIVPFGTTQIRQEGPCTCCSCWVTQYSDAALISDKQFANQDSIKGRQLAYILANRRYLFDRYHVEVEQMSVSQAVYDFWKKVANQQTNGSNLFQTPPPPTSGNIQLISGTVPAVGIFSASAIKTQSLFLSKDDVPYSILPIDTIALSCLDAYRYSTTVKPPFW